jgi:hypothetical protein
MSDCPANTACPLPPRSHDLLRWAQMAGLVKLRADGSWHLTDLGRRSTMRLVAESPAAKPAAPSLFMDM